MPPSTPLTHTGLRQWFRLEEEGNDALLQSMQERIDDNVEWTLIGPGDGELGKSSALAGA